MNPDVQEFLLHNPDVRHFLEHIIASVPQRPEILDDENGNAYDYSGGNIDDAFSLGQDVGSYTELYDLAQTAKVLLERDPAK